MSVSILKRVLIYKSQKLFLLLLFLKITLIMWESEDWQTSLLDSDGLVWLVSR